MNQIKSSAAKSKKRITLTSSDVKIIRQFQLNFTSLFLIKFNVNTHQSIAHQKLSPKCIGSERIQRSQLALNSNRRN